MDKLTLALRIVAGLEGDAFQHWDIFFAEPRPGRRQYTGPGAELAKGGVLFDESMFDYRNRISHQVKSASCELVSAAIHTAGQGS